MHTNVRAICAVLCAATLCLSMQAALAAETGKSSDPKLVPLELKLPNPAFKGTPKDIPVGTTVEPPSDKPRPPLMVPPGLGNVAPGKPMTSSDKNATPSVLAKLTDGDKEAYEDSIVLFRKGAQYVQFDLGASHEVFGILFWHAHNTPKIFRDVVIQVAADADFIENVRTIFNNDQDNSSGLGIGSDREYFESSEGKLIDAKGVKARYVRLYARGSTDSALNEYTEVEIYARPAS